MASALQQYHQLADHMATQITGSYQSWTDFLTTAARLYKYPYHEQLMIYAQRPDATACAEYDLWNKRMGRYIRRGARGIALIDHSGDAPRLRYVFDVADTRGTERSRSPYLWEFHPEHEQVVSDSLELQYDIRYPGSFVRIENALDKMPERLRSVQEQLENLYNQQAAAKAEVGKPFPQEQELAAKTARLIELDMELNLDGKEQPQPEQAIAKSTRPSVLDRLKAPPVHGAPEKPHKKEMEAR